MKKLFLIILLIFLSCSNNNSESCNDKLREIETIEITNSILQYVDKNSISNGFELSDNLQRLTINSYSQNKSIKIEKLKPNQNRSVLVEKLLRTSVDGKLFFEKTDSLNFINQNCKSTFKIPETILRNRKTVRLEKNRNSPNTEYFKIYFPVFSSDNNKAYVEIDIYSKESRFGNSIYLEKVGSSWKIIDIQGLWDI